MRIQLKRVSLRLPGQKAHEPMQLTNPAGEVVNGAKSSWRRLGKVHSAQNPLYSALET